MTEEEVEEIAFVNVTKDNRVLDNFINMIYKMMLDKVPLEYIIEYVIQKGYSGSVGTLKGYMLSIIKNNNLYYYNCSKLLFEQYKYPDDVIIISRLELLKYILTIDEKNKNKNVSVLFKINIP